MRSIQTGFHVQNHVEFGETYCVYVELVLAYENHVMEFPCKSVATHGLYCEEHKCFDIGEDNAND